MTRAFPYGGGVSLTVAPGTVVALRITVKSLPLNGLYHTHLEIVNTS